MNFHEAKSKVWSYKIIGFVIALPAITSTVISMLKMLYFRLEDGTAMGATIARPFKQLVSVVYENTQALTLFWQYSPTPSLDELLSRQNVYFLSIYVLVFVGLAFFTSGGKLNRRLRKINQKIEDQLIAESIRGDIGRNRQQIEESIEVPPSTIFSQFHQLYLAPIFVAVVGGVFLKLAGL
ncbi:YniB family protein (plasmid) [Pseudoalteromonas sp. KG3]|uniref:YfeABCD locus regulator n=1 Tax=Pseudoalteromonas prydzensis TaxID=182141 RepID=A0ABR9FMM2_9GAMM|nr:MULTISPECIES: YniB family protein [Pseudoalteromonas]MBE0458081.1 yfeABCD locus regulator [Pseudoalteromonas prydzensis]WKD26414.1 YniB family protein [Pseudoalteromonas sp. KG3]